MFLTTTSRSVSSENCWQKNAWCHHNCSSFSFEFRWQNAIWTSEGFGQGKYEYCANEFRTFSFLAYYTFPFRLLFLWLFSVCHYPFISCNFLYISLCLSSIFPFPPWSLSSFFTLSVPLFVYVFISLSLFLSSSPLFSFSQHTNPYICIYFSSIFFGNSNISFSS